MTDKTNTPAESEENWVTVSSEDVKPETKMVFEEFGDQFTGTFLGMRELPSLDGPYYQARFSDANGEIYFTNANYSLRDGLKDVRKNTRVRVTLVAEQDTGQASPMRVYRVEVARAAAMAGRAGVRPVG